LAWLLACGLIGWTTEVEGVERLNTEQGRTKDGHQTNSTWQSKVDAITIIIITNIIITNNHQSRSFMTTMNDGTRNRDLESLHCILTLKIYSAIVQRVLHVSFKSGA
jgi:hypothetical protein